MEHHMIPQCSWMGASGDGETDVLCGKCASGYVETRTGHRIYTCEEHIASAKSRAESGRYIHGFRENDQIPPVGSRVAVSGVRQYARLVEVMG